MAKMSEEQIARGKRATARARKVLKPGDRIHYRHCGDVRAHAKFVGWDGDWVCSRTRNDIHAMHIFKLNGQPINFDDKQEAV